jgi:hypothetical protein
MRWEILSMELVQTNERPNTVLLVDQEKEFADIVNQSPERESLLTQLKTDGIDPSALLKRISAVSDAASDLLSRQARMFEQLGVAQSTTSEVRQSFAVSYTTMLRSIHDLRWCFGRESWFKWTDYRNALSDPAYAYEFVGAVIPGAEIDPDAKDPVIGAAATKSPFRAGDQICAIAVDDKSPWTNTPTWKAFTDFVRKNELKRAYVDVLRGTVHLFVWSRD